MRMIAKVCGITCAGDAAMVLAAGADLIGFVRHPASPRHCGDLASASRGIGERGVLVTVGEDIAAMIDAARTHALGWLQPYLPARLRSDAMRTVHAAGLRLLLPWPDQPQQDAPADLYVWETAAAQTGVHGGSGQTHDAQYPPPGAFLLAGGLDGDTVAARIATLPPFVRAQCRGADAASRLEAAPGRKSPSKTDAFARAVHACHV